MLVVSDNPLARTGLALLLRVGEGLTLAGQVGVDDDWPEPGPDAAVWDLGLGLLSGLERLREIEPTATPVGVQSRGEAIVQAVLLRAGEVRELHVTVGARNEKEAR